MPGKRKKTRVNEMAQLVSLLQRALQTPNGPQPQPAKRRQRKRKPRSSVAMMMDGGITLSRSEVVSTIQTKAGVANNSGNFDIVPDSFTFLSTLFKSFDRIRWVRLAFYYKPAVGTTYGGLFSMGVDWDYSSGVRTRANISGLTPNMSAAAWADSQSKPMVLPASRLAGRLWYTPRAGDNVDKGPGSLRWAADYTRSNEVVTLGEIWAVYSVQMMGTNSS